MIVTPVAGYFVLKIPLEPEELKIGIAVMCCAPTVLASSAILADQVVLSLCVNSSVEVVSLLLYCCQWELIS